MPDHLYLVKANDDLISHCACERAFVMFPTQMDCPWCGCGWLFTCMECRKAFTFARAVKTELSWRDLALRDLKNWFSEAPSEDNISEWIEAMQELMEGLEVGQTYVYLDGHFLSITARDLAFSGWAAGHEFQLLPHVQALRDSGVLDSTIGDREYWIKRRIERDDEAP